MLGCRTTTKTYPWSVYSATFIETKAVADAATCHKRCTDNAKCVGFSFHGEVTYVKLGKKPSRCREFHKQDNTKWVLTATVHEPHIVTLLQRPPFSKWCQTILI